MLSKSGCNRVKCKTCSNYLTRHGKTSSGKQRYFCRQCNSSRLYHSSSTKTIMFELFRQYILWGLTYEVLSFQSGYSKSHLIRWFHSFLDQHPPPPNYHSPASMKSVLLIDGLWFTRWFVLMVYRYSGTLKILRISTGKGERKSRIVHDLLSLKEQGYTFDGVVTDGGKPILGALQKVFPRLPHQVCLAHLHRSIVLVLGKRSKHVGIRFLRMIADLVWQVNSHEQKHAFRTLYWWWEEVYQDYLNETHRDETGRWWYVHKGARKACTLLESIYQHCFIFLDYPFLPKTTNEIESQFGHLEKRWLAHRGMKSTRWNAFLAWFVFFYNQEK